MIMQVFLRLSRMKFNAWAINVDKMNSLKAEPFAIAIFHVSIMRFYQNPHETFLNEEMNKQRY